MAALSLMKEKPRLGKNKSGRRYQWKACKGWQGFNQAINDASNGYHHCHGAYLWLFVT